MEPHSQTEDTPKSRSILKGQLRECFGRVVYSHKTQEKCAEILLQKLAVMQLGQIILSAITTGGFISVIFSNKEWAWWGTLVGSLCSLILLILNSYMKNNDLSEQAQNHKEAANNLWYIREKYTSLLVDLEMREKPIENLQVERDCILEELKSIYSNAPNTNFKAYQQAQKALKISEDMTFSDDEIDAFLPKELKSKVTEKKADIPKYVTAE